MKSTLAPSNTAVTNRDPKGRKFMDIVAAAYDKAQLSDGSKGEAQRINDVYLGELSDLVTDFIKKRRVREEYANEEVASKYGYLSGYKKPDDLNAQCNQLCILFPGIGFTNQDLLTRIENREVKLPANAEGWFAIPNWRKNPKIFGSTYSEAVQKVLQGIVTTHGNVIFNGDGYSDAWQEEAASRGLKNLRTTVDAVVEYTSPEVVEVFERYGVLSARELKAREDVIFEYYALTLLVEAKETVEVATTMLLPAAIRFQGELAATAASLKAAGVHTKTPLLTEVSEKIIELDDAIKALTAAIDKMHGKNEYEESRYALEKLIPKMTAVREKADALEPIVADDLWPLPTYIEMLNIL